jgi:amino acid adenylation domain-containing protein
MKSTEQPILDLPLVTAAERHQLLFEWNNTFAKYPDNKCLHELFEEQVERTPNAIAVTLYDARLNIAPELKRGLTYRELNTRSNQLAHYLISLGVGPEVLVGIAVERSIEMVVGLIGILKAGGAYVPLDPFYPKERLRFILKDAQVPILLTQQRLRNGLPHHEAKTVCLDSDWSHIEKYSNANALSGVKPENLAYVIYTSGSTGSPKGTLIMHRGVVNYLCWCIKAYAVADGHGAPVNSSIAFDATITSLFSPLLVGQRVLLLPEEGEIETLSSALISNSYFSLVKITPAHLQILSQLLPANQVDEQTNALIIGGETLPRRSLDLWLEHAPRTRLINEYGPTETVVGCCVYQVSDKDGLAEDIPIGRPIANTQMYILDRHLQPVPIGVAGEIYIGGAGLARGYLNRPELTKERFISNPFSDEPNARLYKTGDIGRYLTDGNIVFLGRLDHQVKIRGYRIELGEIESTLGQHSAVQQVVVIAREDSPGDKRLVAYLVPDPGRKPTTSDLRNFLREKLPEYMMPSLFIFLESLPLTSNGKVDRSALPVPDLQRRDLEKSFLAPRDVIELKLTKIFEECLKVHPIGVQDNFFELGANSIQAAFIFSRIRKTLGKQLHLAILFQAPTIEQLASLLRKEEKAAPWSSLVPIQPKGSKPPIFCVHGGIGTVLFYRDLANHLGMDQPFYGLQAKGLDGIETPHSGIEEMASHYIEEIRTVQPEGPYFLGGYCLGGIVAFEMAKQLIGQGHEVALLANFNAISPTYMHPSHRTINTDEMQLDGKTKSIPAKVSHLRDKLELLSSKEKLVYLLKILKRRSWDQLKNALWNPNTQYKMRGLIYKLCNTLGRPLPEALAKFYLWETNANMVRAYKPQVYPGWMTIFRSPGIYQDPHLGWSGLVGGGIETCDISGEHQYPRQIMIEPFVELLAEELKNYLAVTSNYT